MFIRGISIEILLHRYNLQQTEAIWFFIHFYYSQIIGI